MDQNLPNLESSIDRLSTQQFSSVQFNEISSEAGQMASIPGYTIVSRNTFQYTMI